MKRHPVRELFFHNLRLKLAAIAASVIFFAVVHDAQNAHRTVDVAVIARMPDESGTMLTAEIPARVRLFLEGSELALNSLRAEDLSVNVALASTDTYYYFSEDEFELPSGVRITRFAPSSFPLSWTARAEATVVVLPRFVGELPGGATLSPRFDVVPATVHLSGPASKVRGLTSVQTDAIDLSGLLPGHHQRTIPLEVQEDLVSVLPDAAVRIRFEVVPPAVTRSIEVAHDGGVVSFVLSGPESAIDTVNPQSLVVRPTDAGLTLEALPSGVTAQLQPAEP